MSTSPASTTVVPEIVSKDLVSVVDKSGLNAESANSLKNAFIGFFAEAEKWRAKAAQINVQDPSDTREIKMAREVRLALRDIRIKAEHTRKALKEESLRHGRAVDGVANVLKFLIEPIENRLEEQEKIAERILAERRAKIESERQAKLAPYNVDLTFVNVADMPDATFEQFLENSKAAFERKQEEARKAEAERIRQENERLKEEQRIREENARLKKEADEREAAAKAERERLEKEKAEAEEKARKEKEEIEAKARADREAAEKVLAEERRIAAEKAAADKAKADAAKKAADAKLRKEREENERKLAEERAERERLERELAEKQAAEERRLAEQKAAEERRIAEEKEAARLAALAPDREKLLAFAEQVRALEVPKLSSDSIDTYNFVAEAKERLATLVECEAREMALANPFPAAVNA